MSSVIVKCRQAVCRILRRAKHQEKNGGAARGREERNRGRTKTAGVSPKNVRYPQLSFTNLIPSCGLSRSLCYVGGFLPRFLGLDPQSSTPTDLGRADEEMSSPGVRLSQVYH
ncbi:hypothetical protein TNCV_690571 [Trichonephila clavipes]|nr:hypothetical protein TNCV_690571 [Trichonephila clavipes]